MFPEVIENKLSSQIDKRFLIASEEDETLGQRLILIIEGEKFNLDKSIFKVLDKYEVPKKIYFIPEFVNTFSGKIQRTETLKLLK